MWVFTKETSIAEPKEWNRSAVLMVNTNVLNVWQTSSLYRFSIMPVMYVKQFNNLFKTKSKVAVRHHCLIPWLAVRTGRCHYYIGCRLFRLCYYLAPQHRGASGVGWLRRSPLAALVHSVTTPRQMSKSWLMCLVKEPQLSLLTGSSTTFKSRPLSCS